MTRQQMFDGVWDYFVVHEKPQAKDDAGDCLYQTSNGAKCAIGCFIPDNMFHKDMNGYGDVEDLFYMFPQVKKIFGRLSTDFMTEIQSLHDNYGGSMKFYFYGSFTDYMRKYLTEFAKNNRLKVPKE